MPDSDTPDGDRKKGRLRSTPQEDLELDPRGYDTSANVDLREIAFDPAHLFEQALEQTRMAITITDPRRPGNPLIYVNRAFTELTGYERDEAIGRNCHFLQGERTDPASVQEIIDALDSREVRVVEILNYRKDGSTFWNGLHVGPIFDKKGELTHFYGSQWDVTEIVAKRARIALQDEVANELQHRMRNLFGVMSSIVRLSARNEDDSQVLAETIEARVQALGRAHSLSVSGRVQGEGAVELRTLISAILAPYQAGAAQEGDGSADGERGLERTGRVILTGKEIDVARETVTQIGLVLHELATNSLKYGAFSTAGGVVDVEWRRLGREVELVWRETGGPPIADEADRRIGTGTRIMQGALRGVGGTIVNEWTPEGLVAKVRMTL